MGVRSSIQAIPMTNLPASGLDDAYQLLSATTGLPQACTILRIINNSSVDVLISFDGSTQHDYVPTKTELTVQAQTNNRPTDNVSVFPKGQLVYALGVTSGTGNVYLGGYYNLQNNF